jgi:pyridinium-3,5-bisthiocarboxylic acid mononucleotide nickel chelatase
MKTAYLDCFSGISGDMLLGALLDAGLPLVDLEQTLKGLHLQGWHLVASQETRHEITGTRLVVKIDQASQPPRDFKAIRELISGAGLDEEIKTRSIAVFLSLAKAEGKIHNRPPETVHFHEVGAADSIIDIVGCVYGLTRLGVGVVHSSRLPLGSGFAETAHGRIPIPAPATMCLLRDVPVFQPGLPFELVTPTGAALVKYFSETFGPMPSMTIDSVGYGVGSRDLPDRPNLLRVITGKTTTDLGTETVVVLETNIDDMNPEWMGYLMERLQRAGAMDVAFCPVHMKKNRPGVSVQVVGRPGTQDILMQILFQESGTLGVRFHYTQRRVLAREEVQIQSPWGKMEAKKVVHPDGTSHLVPEYEACKTIAQQKDITLREVYSWVMGLNVDE